MNQIEKKSAVHRNNFSLNLSFFLSHSLFISISNLIISLNPSPSLPNRINLRSYLWILLAKVVGSSRENPDVRREVS